MGASNFVGGNVKSYVPETFKGAFFIDNFHGSYRGDFFSQTLTHLTCQLFPKAGKCVKKAQTIYDGRDLQKALWHYIRKKGSFEDSILCGIR